jgi:hypothetical protein
MATCLFAQIKSSGIQPKLNQAPSAALWASGTDIINPDLSVRRFSTGHEEYLADAILKSRENSIEPWDAFKLSYKINDGDLYKTLRTLFNTFRIHRHDLTFQRKLADLRGSRANGGDSSGLWYHYFGTMLAYETFGSLTKIGEMAYRAAEVDQLDPLKDDINHSGLDTMNQLYTKILADHEDSLLSVDEVCRLSKFLKTD